MWSFDGATHINMHVDPDVEWPPTNNIDPKVHAMSLRLRHPLDAGATRTVSRSFRCVTTGAGTYALWRTRSVGCTRRDDTYGEHTVGTVEHRAYSLRIQRRVRGRLVGRNAASG